ncbi:putative protein C15orf52 [Liparis tanakae]|uniref:Coiled-coil domain-containing protein 9B n=1 Tax=Liparis tanakae TaxID=230148 RepID=A0A4Z2JA97_9TELE|nr:putative protein C15orf52 [Liparis tanakae]
MNAPSVVGAQSDMLPKKDQERDLELDKKIQALRRKNEALMKRHKEVEEDRKRAEEEGVMLLNRKGKAEDLTITISKSTSDSRVVVTKPFSGGSPAGKGQQEAGPDNGGEAAPQGAGRGHRKQLMVTMAGKKESESLPGGTDLNIPTSKEEQVEYVRWKKERVQIDKERVARHRNAKGQWKRAWDMDKNDNMFSDKSLPDRDSGDKGGRNVKRGPSQAGHEKRGKDKEAKDVLVMSSKAKGIDRLTGRARRWQANEDRESLQSADSTLEEFLEELDDITDAEVDDQKDEDPKLKPSLNPKSPSKSEEVSASTAPTQGKAEASSPRGSEKKVRFSEALVQEDHTKPTTGTQDSACSQSRSARSLKASSPKKNRDNVLAPRQPLESAKQDDVRPQDQGGGPCAPPVAQQQATGTECTTKDSSLPIAPSPRSAEHACASPQQSSVQPGELAKCNTSNTNTGMR